MLALIACLTVVQAETRITLDAPFQRLDSIVKGLADRTGRRLSVAPNLSREMVRVQVKDVPLEALLPRLARCAYGEWVRDGERLRLERGLATERKLAEAERAFRAANLRENLARTIEEDYRGEYNPTGSALALRRQVDAWVAKGKEESYDWGIPLRERPKRHALAEGHPADRALIRLAKRLDVEALAAMTDRGGLIFSTKPIGDQRPFSAEMRTVVAQFEKDLAAYAQALDGWPGQTDAVDTNPPARVTLQVQAERALSFGLRINLSLRAYDERGCEIAKGENRLFGDKDEKPAKEEVTNRLALSPSTQEVEKAYRSEGERVQFSPDVIRILRHSDQFPRLAFLWSEVVPHLAKHANVVANVRDDLEDTWTMRDATVDLRLASRELRKNHEVTAETGWLVVRPRFPGPAGAFRYDREWVAAFARDVADHRPVSLERIVGPTPNSQTIQVTRNGHPLTRRFWGLDSAGLVALGSDERALRLLGALPVPHKNRLLLRGGELGWGEFGPALQSEVMLMLLESDAGRSPQSLRPNSPEGSPLPDSDEGQAARDDAHRRKTIIHQIFGERSSTPPSNDLVSRANLRDVKLQVVVENEPALFGIVDRSAPSGPHPYRLHPSSGISREVVPYRNETGPVEVEEQDEPLIKPVERFRPARHRRVQLRLILPGGFGLDQYAEDWAYDPQAPFVLPAQLPPDFLRAIQAARERT